MATVKKKLKAFGRYVWELFKAAFPAMLMYFCAGLVIMMLCMRGDEVEWNSRAITWVVVCNVVAAAYDFLMSWGCGSMHYDMLVSGNIKRISAEEDGVGYKISAHKEAKEYRTWKGFLIGGFVAVFPILFGILLGANHSGIHAEKVKSGSEWLTLFSFVLSGWSVIPFYLMNFNGIFASYFLSCLFALIPIVITGVGYIAGAYAKRNKNMREQLIAQKAAEAEANKPKKINYGGLPGTKPKKKK